MKPNPAKTGPHSIPPQVFRPSLSSGEDGKTEHTIVGFSEFKSGDEATLTSVLVVAKLNMF